MIDVSDERMEDAGGCWKSGWWSSFYWIYWIWGWGNWGWGRLILTSNESRDRWRLIQANIVGTSFINDCCTLSMNFRSQVVRRKRYVRKYPHVLKRLTDREHFATDLQVSWKVSKICNGKVFSSTNLPTYLWNNRLLSDQVLDIPSIETLTIELLPLGTRNTLMEILKRIRNKHCWKKFLYLRNPNQPLNEFSLTSS